MDDGGPCWDELVRSHLISTGALSGIAVLTNTGENCILSYGKLASHTEQCIDLLQIRCLNMTALILTKAHKEVQDWLQFTSLFMDTSTPKVHEAVSKLSLTFEREVPFIIFHKSQCSLYATSAGNLHGLIVCSFPLGVIVCTCEPPTPMSKAITAVENFCSMLRR